MVKLYLINQFRLVENGREIDNFRSQKVKALLVYLVLTDEQPIARSALQALLWSDYTPKSAQASLRVTLSNLRQLFSHIDDLLVIERYTVYFNRSHPAFWCDLLDDATELADQPLLPDLHHIGSPRFQEWLEAEQTAHAEQLHKTERKTNISRALRPLFGREMEIEQLTERILADETPLVTIAGVGGVGKTQLALAIGRSLQEQFTHGVWFLPLTTYVATDDIGQTIAANLLELLQDAPVNQSDSQQRLFAFLRPRHLLLILDNIEQLVQKPQFAEFLLQLLDRAPNVHLLATSRRRLAISAEWVHELQQLAVPADENMPLAQLRQYASVQLFAEKAQRVWTTFALSAANGAEIAQICRMVGGLPLGIELAAAQIVQRSSAEIVTLLTQSLAKLHNPEHDARHASLQTVFDHSWALLSADLQQILAACALFQGDFSLQSARAVTGGSVEQILYLVQHSLIQQVAPARFDLHPMVAEFAAHKLDLDGRRAAAESRYLTHYLDFAARQKVPLFKLATRTPVEMLQRELKQIQAAWSLAVQCGNFALLSGALETLYLFFTRAFGQFQTFITLTAQIETSFAPDALRHTAAIYKAHVLVLNGQSQAALTLITDVTEQVTSPRLRTIAHNVWGIILSYEANIQAARPRLAEAWRIAQDSDDLALERIDIVRHLIHAERVLGERESVENRTQNALALAQSDGYRYAELMLRYDLLREQVSNYHYARALATATSLLPHAVELQLVKSELDWLSIVAHCCRVQGEHRRALTTISRCMDILAANMIGSAYEIFIGQYYVIDLIAHGDFGKAAQQCQHMVEQVADKDGYIWEVAYLSAMRVQLARQNVDAAERTLTQLRSKQPLTNSNPIYYQQAELQFALLTDAVNGELVETYIEQLATFSGYIALELYKTLIDALNRLQDQRMTAYAQLAQDTLDQRAAGIVDPNFREKYLAYQRQLLAIA